PMYIWIRFLDPDHQWRARKKLLDELENQESDNENDHKVSMEGDQIELMELNRQPPPDKEQNGANLEDPSLLQKDATVRDTPDRLKNDWVFGLKWDDLFDFHRQQLFIKQQPPLWKMIKL